jgi:putative ABC transport system permease protein
VRNILVVSQFVIAAILIASVFLIRRQVSFMENYDMGFQPNDVVAIPTENEAMINGHLEGVNAYANLINISRGTNGIASAAVSENIPGYYFNNTFGVVPVGTDDKQSVQMVVSSMDENFVDAYKIKLIEGRNFSVEHGADKYDAVIINESAQRSLGWSSAVGKEIWYVHEHHPLTVIGVMKDINIASLQNTVQPMVYRYAAAPWERSFVSVRLNPSRIGEGLNFLRASWRKVFPNSPFEYFFVRDKYGASYASEGKTETIIEVFSALAIFLAGLGLFGLSSLKVTQRTKEIGVRKVLGASIPDILRLFSREFLLLVLAGNLVAIPISYFVFNRWLQDFAYRTNIGFGIFIITAVLTLLIAFITVSVQAIRAATANPVECLRYE